MNKKRLVAFIIIAMRISIVQIALMASFACSIYANTTEAQILDKLVSVKARNIEIKTIIAVVKQQVGIKFIFSSDLIKGERKISCEVKGKKLSEFLDEVLIPLNIGYKIFDNQILLFPLSGKEKSNLKVNYFFSNVSPQRIVTGIITDENGQALEGVTIKVMDGTGMAVTKENGRFTISMPDTKTTLLFSFIGFIDQQVKLQGRTTLTVVLKKQTSNLDDVVVIAYGKSSRRAISNSIVSIAAKDVENIPVGSVAEAMVGLVPGVDISLPTGEPGSSPVIRVRGVGSIGAGNSPLYVVDGYPLNSPDNFSLISPSDIQSIQILKDAAACAIYGSRGGNGIILVTTKSGMTGKTKFSFNAYTGIQNVSKKIGLLNGPQFVSFLKDAYVNAATVLPTSYIDSTATYANTDWQDVIFRTGVQSNYQLSASGGSAATKYYISGNYFKQEGTVKGSGIQKFSVRANYDAKLTNNLKIGLSMAPSFSILDTKPISGTFNGSTITGGGASTVGAIVTDALLIAPTMPVWIPNGDYAQYSNTATLMTINIYNPLATIDLYKDHTNSFKGIGISYLEWEVVKGLTLKTSFGGEMLFSRRNWYIPATLATASSALANLSNPLLAGLNSMQTNNNSYNWVWENTLNYNLTIAHDHKINFLAGYAAQHNNSEGGTVFGQAGTYTNTAVNYVTAAGQIFGTASYGANALASLFGRINYNYNDKYLLSAAIRKDGSSRFGSDNRFATFPSISAAWRMTEERFMHKIKGISELKIRASYGVTGNNDIGDFSWQSYETSANYVFGANAGARVYGFVPNSIAIRNLTWETNKQVDGGLEIGLFNNRIYLTVDAYQRNTTNLLLNRNVPSLIGFATRVLSNVGEVRNRGLEFALATQNTIGKFKWSTNANISFNNNVVMALGGESDQILFDAVFGYTSSIRVLKGKPLGSFYGYKQTGVYMNAADVVNSPKWSTGSKPGDIKYADLSGPAGKPDGIIDANDITYLGNALPKYVFGFTNTFEYNNFQLNVTLQGRVGGQILNGALRYTYNFYGKVNAPVSMANRWRSDTETGDGWTPRAVINAPSSLTSFSSHELFDASFLRVRNVSLRYNLHGDILNKLRLQSASFYITGQNLFTISKYFGYNPEANIYGNTTNPTYGVDQGAYPLAKSFTCGLNIGF